LVFLPGTLGVVASGCGGGAGSPSVANLGTTTTGTAPTKGGRRTTKVNEAVLVTCLRAHGLQASVGSAGTASNQAIDIGGAVITGANPSSPQFQSALNACRKYLPGGGPPKLTPAQQAEAAKAMTRFSACMRSHGVPGFPDPNSKGSSHPGASRRSTRARRS
jgi:hypothetical protein